MQSLQCVLGDRRAQLRHGDMHIVMLGLQLSEVVKVLAAHEKGWAVHLPPQMPAGPSIQWEACWPGGFVALWHREPNVAQWGTEADVPVYVEGPEVFLLSMPLKGLDGGLAGEEKNIATRIPALPTSADAAGIDE